MAAIQKAVEWVNARPGMVVVLTKALTMSHMGMVSCVMFMLRAGMCALKLNGGGGEQSRYLLQKVRKVDLHLTAFASQTSVVVVLEVQYRGRGRRKLRAWDCY